MGGSSLLLGRKAGHKISITTDGNSNSYKKKKKKKQLPSKASSPSLSPSLPFSHGVHPCAAQAICRLKREEHCLPPAYDRLFSAWQVIVGPEDWQNHTAGLEAAERYRLHNLPSYSGPGVYELAIHWSGASGSHATRSSSQPRGDNCIVVYVGQAENVRTRLQHYGRSGSHLEGGTDSSCFGKGAKSLHANSPLENKKDLNCPQLFTKSFSQGYAIVFRWTAAESKADAQAIETGLLKRFDYAWNRGSNGERRPCDTFMKIEQLVMVSRKSPKPFRVFHWTCLHWGTGRAKTRRSPRKPSRARTVSDGTSILFADLEALPWKELEPSSKPVIKFCGPRQKIGVCGILDAQGKACTASPLQGRKRCELHKGMRLSNKVLQQMVANHAVRPQSQEGLERSKGTQKEQPSSLLHCEGQKHCKHHKGRRAKF